jgi:hypothetical protein
MSADSLFLVPTVDLHTLECSTVAVSAPNECAAVWEVLHRSPSLRYTGGAVELVEPRPEFDVVRDVWAERWRRPAQQKENVR